MQNTADGRRGSTPRAAVRAAARGRVSSCPPTWRGRAGVARRAALRRRVRSSTRSPSAARVDAALGCSSRRRGGACARDLFARVGHVRRVLRRLLAAAAAAAAALGGVTPLMEPPEEPPRAGGGRLVLFGGGSRRRAMLGTTTSCASRGPRAAGAGDSSTRPRRRHRAATTPSRRGAAATMTAARGAPRAILGFGAIPAQRSDSSSQVLFGGAGDGSLLHSDSWLLELPPIRRPTPPPLSAPRRRAAVPARSP